MNGGLDADNQGGGPYPKSSMGDDPPKGGTSFRNSDSRIFVKEPSFKSSFVAWLFSWAPPSNMKLVQELSKDPTRAAVCNEWLLRSKRFWALAAAVGWAGFLVLLACRGCGS